MKLRKYLVLATTLGLAISTPALAGAGTTASIPPVGAAGTLVSARKLVALMHVDQTFDRLNQQLVPLVTGNVIATLEKNPAIPADLRAQLGDPGKRQHVTAVFDEEMTKAFRARYPTMLEATAAEYANDFSEAEIQNLIAFYSSGTGAKLLAAMPEIQARLGKIGQNVGMVAGADAFPKALARLILPDGKAK